MTPVPATLTLSARIFVFICTLAAGTLTGFGEYLSRLPDMGWIGGGTMLGGAILSVTISRVFRVGRTSGLRWLLVLTWIIASVVVAIVLIG